MRAVTRSLLTLATAALVGLGLAGCEGEVVPSGDDPTADTPSTGSGSSTEGETAYPDDLVIRVAHLSGSVPPPNDSMETVEIGPDGLTYTAGSRYADTPLFSETVPADDAVLEDVMAAWEALVVPAETGDDYDSSHSIGGVGGDYVNVLVTGSGYDSVAAGDDDAMSALVATAIGHVPADARAGGQAAIERYNAGEDVDAPT